LIAAGARSARASARSNAAWPCRLAASLASSTWPPWSRPRHHLPEPFQWSQPAAGAGAGV